MAKNYVVLPISKYNYCWKRKGYNPIVPEILWRTNDLLDSRESWLYIYIYVLERILLYEYIRKNYNIGMHWKDFYYKNALEKLLQ